MATKNVKGVKRADGNTYLYVDQAARTKIGTATLTTTAQDLSGAVNELKSGKADLEGGKIPASQLPSYVDDVLEYANKASFPATGEAGKIYIDKATNKQYRWSGTAYVEISESLALGETSSTAYAGNKGKANADAIAVLNGTGAGSVNKTVSDAIATLDVASVGGSGKYISAISETDGKINATSRGIDNIPIAGSPDPVKSDGVFNAIKNSVSLKSATGNPITLTDAANVNAEELSMTIEPIQDLHGYSKPWPAGGGKNIAHIDSTKIFNTNKNPSDPITGIADGMLILGAAANGYIRTATLGSYTINNPNSITAEVVDNASFGVGIVVEVDDTKTYTLNLVKTGGDVEIGWLNNDGSSLSSAGQQTLPVNLTPPTGAKYLLIVCLPGLTEHTFSNIQLEVGTSASTFEPWENICPISGLTSGEVETTDGTDTNTATIAFGQTVYGGNVDFKTGKITVTHGIVDLGTLNWSFLTDRFITNLIDNE